jgi:hypothetical protein
MLMWRWEVICTLHLEKVMNNFTEVTGINFVYFSLFFQSLTIFCCGSSSHHIHQIQQSPSELKKYDLRHKISTFRCGPHFPGRVDPLDGFTMSQPGNLLYADTIYHSIHVLISLFTHTHTFSLWRCLICFCRAYENNIFFNSCSYNLRWWRLYLRNLSVFCD